MLIYIVAMTVEIKSLKDFCEILLYWILDKLGTGTIAWRLRYHFTFSYRIDSHCIIAVQQVLVK